MKPFPMHTNGASFPFNAPASLPRSHCSILSQNKKTLPSQRQHLLVLCGDLKNDFPAINSGKTVNNIGKDALGENQGAN